MKALVIILIFIFLLAGFKSEFFPGSTRFYVKHIKETEKTSDYHLIQESGPGAVWITAAPGTYHIGDTLSLQPVSHAKP